MVVFVARKVFNAGLIQIGKPVFHIATKNTADMKQKENDKGEAYPLALVAIIKKKQAKSRHWERYATS